MPLVTLIIPVYNAERYLRRCLDSVAAQTFTDMEVLLMNDGSTDGSLAICKEYEERDLRFHTIDKENTGVSNTRIYSFWTVTTGSHRTQQKVWYVRQWRMTVIW